MKGEVMVRVEGVSKKFARSLRRSMFYGLLDMGRDAVGLASPGERLRADEFWAVSEVNFTVRRGECLGLIGANGAGKSTVLKMLNGLFEPDRGRLELRGKVGALIELGAGFHPLLSGRENIYINGAVLGLSRREIDRDLESIIDFSGVGDFLDMPVKFYSSGMYVRLGFAVAIHLSPEVLLLDEILAVGDVPFQAKCFNEIGRIREQGAAVILVSHNLHRVAGICDRVAYLRHGRLVHDGDKEQGIRRYLEDSEQGLPGGGAEGADMSRVNGTGRMAITGVSFHDGSGRPVERIWTGETLKVRISYRCQEVIENPVLDFSFKGPGAVPLFQGTNLDYETELGKFEGEGTMEVEIDQLNVNNHPVEFFFTLWNRGRTELFDWKRCIPFRVDGVATSTGLLRYEMKWRNRGAAAD